MLVMQQQVGNREDVVEIWLPDGRTVEVELVGVRSNDRSRIGYTAPADVNVYRKCVANAIRRKNSAAAATAPAAGVK